MTSAPDPRIERLTTARLLAPADGHVADTVCRLTGDGDPDVRLAVALAVHAVRNSHVCLDLARTTTHGVVTGEVSGAEPGDVALPARDVWLSRLRASPAVRVPTAGEASDGTPTPADGGRGNQARGGEAGGGEARGGEARGDEARGDEARGDDLPVTPLVLDGDRLYLDRYWRYEQRVAHRLRQLAGEVSDPPDGLDELLAGLFGDLAGTTDQQQACRAGATHRLTVLTGGPGTGKTTTILRLLAVLATSFGDTVARMVLSAPTGKAAARLAETIRTDVDRLPITAATAEQLRATPATTLHRLLGWQPHAPSRFRHDASRPLPYDVVVVDEASMVSLPLMAKLLDALGEGTRLILVGDREQLASIDAGAVFADVCGPRSTHPAVAGSGQSAHSAGDGGLGSAHPAADSGLGSGHPVADSGLGSARPVGDDDAARRPQVVELKHNFRFDAASGLADIAAAVREGDAERVVGLASPHAVPEGRVPLADAVWSDVIERYIDAAQLARAGAPPIEVLGAFDRVRVLAALRRGPHGVEAINHAIAGVLAARLGDETRDASREPVRVPAVGTPLLVTRNDHRIELYNGDVGVVVADPSGSGHPVVAFAAAGGEVRLIAPARLPASEPVYALSVHKSQGSQFDEVVLVLPSTDTPLLTRELVYTGVTRARSRLTLVADRDVLAAALARRVQRASGLRQRLWGTTEHD